MNKETKKVTEVEDGISFTRKNIIFSLTRERISTRRLNKRDLLDVSKCCTYIV